jgi:hypothetical protein
LSSSTFLSCLYKYAISHSGLRSKKADQISNLAGSSKFQWIGCEINGLGPCLYYAVKNEKNVRVALAREQLSSSLPPSSPSSPSSPYHIDRLEARMSALGEVVIEPLREGKFECKGEGLTVEGVARENANALRDLLKPGVPGGITDKDRSKSWWKGVEISSSSYPFPASFLDALSRPFSSQLNASSTAWHRATLVSQHCVARSSMRY